MLPKKTQLHYHQLANQIGYIWIGKKLPKNTDAPTKWRCAERHIWKANYQTIKSGHRCRRCFNVRTSKRLLKIAPLLEEKKCFQCQEVFPIDDFYRRSERLASGMKRLRYDRNCKDCRKKYYATRRKLPITSERKKKRNEALKRYRQRPGRCQGCAIKILNSQIYRLCIRCYINHWIADSWYQIKRFNPDKAKLAEKDFYRLSTIFNKCDIANMPGARHFPETRLTRQVPFSKAPASAFKISNLQWITLPGSRNLQLNSIADKQHQLVAHNVV
jgi:hypothetical protein